MSTHFNDKEFDCSCGVATCPAPKKPHRLLALYLDRAREMLGAPIVITSGNRCPEHNRLEGGEDPSEHVWPDGCLGCDVEVSGARHRWQLHDALRHAGFTRVGVYGKHFHVGVGEMVVPATFAPNVEWTPKGTPA